MPVALDKNFEFRKTKLLYIGEKGPQPSARLAPDDQHAQQEIHLFVESEDCDASGCADYL
jgi:hypothetical protein